MNEELLEYWQLQSKMTKKLIHQSNELLDLTNEFIDFYEKCKDPEVKKMFSNISEYYSNYKQIQINLEIFKADLFRAKTMIKALKQKGLNNLKDFDNLKN